MAEVASKKHRIVHIAKELNISHKDIIELLNKNGIEVQSHMSPVDEQTYQIIIEEFEKDLLTVERYRKEKIRKEIHSRKLEERLHTTQTLEIMMPQEQRKLEEAEKKALEEQVQAKKLEIEAELKAAEEALAAKDGGEEEKREEKGAVPVAEDWKKKPKPAKKLKLRRIDISEIESQIESRRRKPTVKAPQEGGQEAKDERESIDSTIRKTLAMMDTKTKRKKYRKARAEDEEEIAEEELQTIKAKDFMSVQELANVLNVTPTHIITKCLELGIPATINQRLDMDTISLLADDLGYRVQKVEESIDDLFSLENSADDMEKLVPRAPVVTIMGHVDHGKTSLLDYIRNTNVVAGEAGGITQHIGAYQVELGEGRMVTFLDTPGHESFTAMRARGAQVTDVVILIVAAEDGVKPQTLEAIDHARAASVPIVVAINKIDKKDANPDGVKRELFERGILVEEWGGKYQCVEVSAKKGEGIDELLELLALETDVLELKANPDTDARATVIESRLDKGHGPIATVLVQKGTLHVGDPFICGGSYGKVRALLNERNTREESASPSEPIQVLGFQTLPQAGDRFAVVADEKYAKRLASERDRIQREIDRQMVRAKSLDQFSEEIREGLARTLHLVVKADVDGSVEALADALSALPQDEVKVDIVHKGVGDISESDILLASASGAIAIGFNVRVRSNAKLLAKNNGVDIRQYTVIYDAVNEIKLALEGLLEPEIVVKTLGKAEVKQVFKVSKVGNIAGCSVLEGVISRKDQARVWRDDEQIGEGKVTSLKHFQDDAKSIEEGKECGIGIEGVKSFQVGDIIETFETEEIKRTLK